MEFETFLWRLGLSAVPGLAFAWFNNILFRWQVWAMLGVWTVILLLIWRHSLAGPREKKFLNAAMIAGLVAFFSIDAVWPM